MVSTVNPKAKATPAKPIPRPGKAAASTAAPQPPNVNQNVPINSAAACCAVAVITTPPSLNEGNPSVTEQNAPVNKNLNECRFFYAAKACCPGRVTKRVCLFGEEFRIHFESSPALRRVSQDCVIILAIDEFLEEGFGV